MRFNTAGIVSYEGKQDPLFSLMEAITLQAIHQMPGRNLYIWYARTLSDRQQLDRCGGYKEDTFSRIEPGRMDGLA